MTMARSRAASRERRSRSQLEVLLLAALVTAADSILDGSLHIKNAYVRKDEVDVFDCKFAYPPTKLMIKFDIPKGVRYQYQDKVAHFRVHNDTISVYRRRLKVFADREIHGKTVGCTINTTSKVFYRGLRYYLIGKPTVTIVTSSVTFRAGEAAHLSCRVVSIPPNFTVSWRLNQRLLTIDGVKYQGATLADPTLTIANLTVKDTGVYRCQASNDEGETSSVGIRLTVRAPLANVSVTPSRITVAEGSPFSALCSAADNGSVTLAWYLKDRLFQHGAALYVRAAAKKYQESLACRLQRQNEFTEARLAVLVVSLPNVTVRQTFYAVTRSSSVTLQCQVTPDTKVNRVRWLQGDRNHAAFLNVMRSRGKYRGGSPSSPSLTINNVASEDVGRYRCEAANEAGNTSSPDVIVQLADTVAVSTPETQVAVREGTPHTLHCLITAPPPSYIVTWYKDDKALDTSSSRFAGGTASNPNLTLVSAGVEDEGSYICAISFSAEVKKSSVVNLTVVYPPKHISMEPGWVRARELQAVRVKCGADAKPAPHLSWLLRGGRLVEGDTLVIPAVTAQDMLHHYTCLAQNSVGSSMLDLRLDVQHAPVVVVAREDYVANRSQSLTLSCLVRARPPASTLLWERLSNGSSTPLDLASPQGKYSGGDTRTPALTIHNVTSEDEGAYRCVAMNSLGTTWSRPMQLFVSYAPTTVHVRRDDGTFMEGSALQLTCESDGFPLPEFSWFRVPQGLTNIASGRKFQKTATHEDHTTFRCVAYNHAGLAYGDRMIEVLHKPRTSHEGVNVLVSFGKEVTLTCDLTAYPEPEAEGYTWHYGNLVLDGRERNYSFMAEQEAMGNYICTGRNIVGQSRPKVFAVQGQKSSLSFQMGPFKTLPEDHSLRVKSIIIFFCVAAFGILSLMAVYKLCSGREPEEEGSTTELGSLENGLEGDFEWQGGDTELSSSFLENQYAENRLRMWRFGEGSTGATPSNEFEHSSYQEKGALPAVTEGAGATLSPGGPHDNKN